MSEERMVRLQQKIVNLIMEEWRGWVNDILKDALNVEKLQHFMRHFARSMGVDFGQLAGMVGQQPGFDPYQVLGLDKSASDEEIKKRYREFLHHLHPDTAGYEGTSFFFQMALAAYNSIKMERGWQ